MFYILIFKNLNFMSKRIIIILSVLSLLIILLIVSSQSEKNDFVEGRIIDFEQTSITTFSSIRIVDFEGKSGNFILIKNL